MTSSAQLLKFNGSVFQYKPIVNALWFGMFHSASKVNYPCIICKTVSPLRDFGSSGKCMCVSFFCTCRSHIVFPPGLSMCPSLNVAFCVPFLDNALHIQKRQPVGIWRWNTLTSCMALLIASLLNIFLFSTLFLCGNFLWGVYFFLLFKKSHCLMLIKERNITCSIKHFVSPIFRALHYLLLFHVLCFVLSCTTNFHHGLRCPSYRQIVLYFCVSAWALHVWVSLFLSLGFCCFLPFIFLVFHLSPLCFSALGMLVVLSALHVFFSPISLFLFVQGMCCFRWLRSTDRSKCS